MYFLTACSLLVHKGTASSHLCLSSYTRYYRSKVDISMRMSKKDRVLIPKSSRGVLYESSINQKTYETVLNDNLKDKIVIVVGPAGTGKTFMACKHAVKNIINGDKDKIILTRPLVSVDEEIGFLPGSLTKKMEPWTKPIFDILEEYFSKNDISNLVTNGKIDICNLGMMRGRTFNNAFIIGDEMQNTSPAQMYMFLTRIGKNSTMVITGDLEQSDRQEENGLKNLIDKYKKNGFMYDNIHLIELDKKDVQRSKLVEQVMEMYHPAVNTTTTTSSEVVIPKKNETNRNKYTDMDAALIPYKDMCKEFAKHPNYSL
jgi:phosphate starvation-inducible PhoH-like protein